MCQNQEGEVPLVLAEYGGHDEVGSLIIGFWLNCCFLGGQSIKGLTS